jgi:hypothetical protein
MRGDDGAAAAADAPIVAPNDDLRRVATLFLELGVDVLRCVDGTGRTLGSVTREAVAARLSSPAAQEGAGEQAR